MRLLLAEGTPRPSGEPGAALRHRSSGRSPERRPTPARRCGRRFCRRARHRSAIRPQARGREWPAGSHRCHNVVLAATAPHQVVPWKETIKASPLSLHTQLDQFCWVLAEAWHCDPATHYRHSDPRAQACTPSIAATPAGRLASRAGPGNRTVANLIRWPGAILGANSRGPGRISLATTPADGGESLHPVAMQGDDLSAVVSILQNGCRFGMPLGTRI